MKQQKNPIFTSVSQEDTDLITSYEPTDREPSWFGQPRWDAPAFPAVSLFTSWYLRREQLAKNKKIKQLLDEMNADRNLDYEKWCGSLRWLLSNEAIRVLRKLLERPLSGSELVRLFDRIDEFIQLYAAGVKP